MNIAIIGGGKRCRTLLELIKRYTFKEISPKVVAVADERGDAPGLIEAGEQGIFVTHDYNVFFERKDIHLIIELTGKKEVYHDIMQKKRKDVRVIDHKMALLFWEISRISNMQKETKRKLREKGLLCDVVINDLIKEDVIIIGSDYRIKDINDSMLERLGIEFEDAIGRYCYEITHHQNVPCSGKKHPCPLEEVLETWEPSQSTHVHLDKDDNEICYSISCYPLFQEGGVTGAIEISRDITEDINMQKIMMRQEKLASVGRLSAGVAHEINNPLTTILTTAMLIQEDLDPDDPTYEELELVANETLRCRKIVTSLLDFARQTKPEKKYHNINEIIAESILLTKKQIAFKDVAVKHHFSDDIPNCYIDKGQIQQSLINLILNAAESTAPGGEITVTTASLPQNNMAEIRVKDTGEGISGDKIDKIFDPFYTTKKNGTGLGLAITHGIIEQHGGTTEARSKSGEGTVFTIRIPVGKGLADDQ